MDIRRYSGDPHNVEKVLEFYRNEVAKVKANKTSRKDSRRTTEDKIYSEDAVKNELFRIIKSDRMTKTSKCYKIVNLILKQMKPYKRLSINRRKDSAEEQRRKEEENEKRLQKRWELLLEFINMAEMKEFFNSLTVADKNRLDKMIWSHQYEDNPLSRLVTKTNWECPDITYSDKDRHHRLYDKSIDEGINITDITLEQCIKDMELKDKPDSNLRHVSQSDEYPSEIECDDWRKKLLMEHYKYLDDKQQHICKLMWNGYRQVEIQKMEHLTPSELRAVFDGIERILKNPPTEHDLNTTKPCRICGEVKPLIEFGKDKSRKDGHTSMCKACRNKKNQEKKKSCINIKTFS